MPGDAAALGRGGITAAGEDLDPGKGNPGGGKEIPELGEGLQQILPDIVVQRLQGRYVEDGSPADGQSAGDELVEIPEEGGQGLAGAGGRGDQDMLAAGDALPGLELNFRGFGVALVEPFPQEWVEPQPRYPSGVAVGAPLPGAGGFDATLPFTAPRQAAPRP